MAHNELDTLRHNLKRYTLKQYGEAMLRGLLITLVTAGVLWFVLSLAEYFGHFERSVRGWLFFAFVALTAGFFLVYIINPLLRAMGILPQKPAEKVARELGEQIQPIDDKLYNTIMLEQRGDKNNPLIQASLEQRARTLNQFDFSSAVDLSKFRLWLRYSLVVFGALIAVSLFNPEMAIESSSRLVNYSRDYTPPAPYSIIINNPSLEAVEGEPFVLDVSTQGSVTPDFLFMETNEARYRLKPTGDGRFTFEFVDPRSDVEFRIYGSEASTPRYTIKVLPVPRVVQNRVIADFPEYTGLKDEELVNRTALKVPEGTRLTWNIVGRNSDTLLAGGVLGTDISSTDQGSFVATHTAEKSGQLLFVLRGKNNLTDTMRIALEVIPDQYPRVMAEQFVDSLSGARFFKGAVSDDYGISSLHFVIQRTSDGQKPIDVVRQKLNMPNNVSQFSFSHMAVFDTLNISPGSPIIYYFEAADNDALHGPKIARSTMYEFKLPSAKEIADAAKTEAEKTKSLSEKQQNELSKINEELEKLRQELLNKKEPDWQDKQALEELIEKQKRMLEEFQQQSERQVNQLEKLKKTETFSEEILQKQERIQELFDKLFDEEFKEKYDQLQKMIDELDKRKMLKKIDEMKMDAESLEKELDRTLELFKELEFEMQLERVANKAEELKQKQDELNNKLESKSEDPSSLSDQQKELNKELDELKQEMNELERLNEALEKPSQLPDTKNDAEEADRAMQEAAEQMEQNNRKKAEESGEKASEKLNEMSKKMKSFQEAREQKQKTENLEDMRQLLENLIDLSHEQERILEQTKVTKPTDPKYMQAANEQKKLIDDTKVVEDSLLALSKRVEQLERTINDQVLKIKSNMQNALEAMTNQPPNETRRYNEMAQVSQQLAMTGLNELANLLDEIIRQAQQEMSSKMTGDGQCSKPGSGKPGKPSASDLRKMQENLNKQLQQLKEALEKGENQGGMQPGKQPGQMGSKMSRDLARMAAQQAAIREQLRELSNALDQKENGAKAGKQIRELEELMQRTEEDILYQRITQETIKRQQEIITRLLESEKAEREQEQEQKRESKRAIGSHQVPDEVWKEYEKKRERELELYETIPPDMKPYYRNIVNRYFSEFAE
ncbi:MAG: ATPase [Salibacteraceae bacterium]